MYNRKLPVSASGINQIDWLPGWWFLLQPVFEYFDSNTCLNIWHSLLYVICLQYLLSFCNNNGSFVGHRPKAYRHPVTIDVGLFCSDNAVNWIYIFSDFACPEHASILHVLVLFSCRMPVTLAHAPPRWWCHWNVFNCILCTLTTWSQRRVV